MGRSPEAWCAAYLDAAFRAGPAYGVGFLSGDLGAIAVATVLAHRTASTDASMKRVSR
jgi:hypothetical protein